MRNLRKILISSIILIVIGILGLAVTLPMAGRGITLTNFGTGQGYIFNSEDMNHMFRNLFGSRETANLDFNKVESLTEKYLDENNLSNLEISEIMEFSQNFYIELIEKDTAIGAMELLVDKSSGVIFPEYGPNMMWNLKYGMHSRIPLSQSSIDMPIDEDEALDIAGKYMAKINTGESAGDEAEKFYGYYTIHTETENGEVAGMLSVNGYTGQIWYHSWHGIFIDMVEINNRD
ncbi:MAG TPA: hypothetical protein VIH13_05455 [Candidatus Hydromicrobium sp.]